MLQGSPINLKAMIYEEGNLDEGDCFGSKKLADAGAPPVSEQSSQGDIQKFGQWVCAKDLVEVSMKGNLMQRLLDLRSEKGLRIIFTYGEKNRYSQ